MEGGNFDMASDWFTSANGDRYTLEDKSGTWWIYVNGSPRGGGSNDSYFQRQEFERLKRELS